MSGQDRDLQEELASDQGQGLTVKRLRWPWENLVGRSDSDPVGLGYLISQIRDITCIFRYIELFLGIVMSWNTKYTKYTYMTTNTK